MAEMPRKLTQAEIDRILFNQRYAVQPQAIQNLQQGVSGTITPIKENIFQRMAGGAKAAGDYVNKAGTAADIAKLFPGYTGQSQVTIPTGFSFAPKQAPTGEIIPGGLQTQQMNVGQLLSAIKPADVLGITGAQQAYTDIGAGRMPKPLDVLDVAGVGAIGYGAGKGLLKATKNVPVGLSIKETTGLLQTAPKSDIGFYSAVEQAAMNTPRKAGAGQAFLNDIMKGPDVRADEIKWIGLDEFLKGKQNVTKQEVQDYIANNRVDVQEVRSTIPRLPGEEMPGDKGAFLPKFGQYTLPGGENYRELLLTMPNKKSPSGWTAKDQGGGMWVVFDETGAQRGSVYDARNASEAIAQKASETSGEQYISSHFPDQRNILAHLRVNDRVDADGKKMLLIEEVQSDWHQAGREKGYKTKENLENWYNQNKLDNDPPFSSLNSEQISVIERNRNAGMGGDTGVPDAPFKDTWYQLALKRAIQHAAENGYDRIGLTTGSQQAARFDLSKQISELHYSGTNLVAYDKAGNQVIQKTGVAEADLPGLIGKEAAKKLMEQPKQGTLRSLVGQELQVGGEGMKKYYDEIYPKFLDKYGKKWGARVGETSIGGTGSAFDYYKSGNMFDVIDGNNNVVGRFNSAQEAAKQVDKLNSAGTETIRYLDITPEMKAGVSRGQPLFQAAPIITGGGLLGSQQEER